MPAWPTARNHALANAILSSTDKVRLSRLQFLLADLLELAAKYPTNKK